VTGPNAVAVRSIQDAPLGTVDGTLTFKPKTFSVCQSRGFCTSYGGTAPGVFVRFTVGHCSLIIGNG
jgi:hypothetical protein